MSPEDKSEITLYFINGEKGIPYIAMTDGAGILKRICGDAYSMTVEVIGDKLVVLTRENGEIAAIDVEADTISYSHINSFNALPHAVNCLDIIDIGKPSCSEGFVQSTSKTEKNVSAFTIDLGAYCIDMVIRDGIFYLPLQTFSDFFVGSLAQVYAIYYNGKCLIYSNCLDMNNLYMNLKMEGNELTPLVSLYMNAEPTEKTSALTAFNYCELCAMLDYTYGLKANHNISNFETLFADYGLLEALLDTDATATAIALQVLTFHIFADSHSASTLVSPLCVRGITEAEALNAISGAGNVLVRSLKHKVARNAAAPDGYPGYEEIGNTAFITFDSFVCNLDTDHNYYTAEAKNDASDTIALLLYANQQLHREGCPIENVVIDLTSNGGGMADAAICVVSFFLGDCDLNIRDTVTGSQGSTQYMVDLNRDGKFETATDSVLDKNLYCLISPCSFSCGNLVPATFKSSDQVTLIGRSSSGGTCCVAGRSTADGNGLQLSSPLCLSSNINGSYYDVDQGVQPDIYIDDVNHLCDHTWMAEFIDQLP